MRIRLGDEDRKALGVDDEWLRVDLTVLPLREACDLEDAGIKYAQYRALLAGEPVFDDEGKPVLDEDGDPARVHGMHSWRLFAWLAVRRSGVLIGYHDGPFAALDVNAVRYEAEAAEVKTEPDAEGKDDTGDPTSEP